MIRRYMSAVVLSLTGLVMLPAVTVTATAPAAHPETTRPTTPKKDLSALQGCNAETASVHLDGENPTITADHKKQCGIRFRFV